MFTSCAFSVRNLRSASNACTRGQSTFSSAWQIPLQKWHVEGATALPGLDCLPWCQSQQGSGSYMPLKKAKQLPPNPLAFVYLVAAKIPALTGQ